MDPKDLYHELKEMRHLLGDVRIILARNTDSLDLHIKRTDLLERRLELLDKDVTKLRGFFTIGGWLLGVMATLLTILSKIGVF